MRLIDCPDNPLPPGAAVHTVDAGDGVRLRVARWAARAQGPAGTCVVLPGRSEFIEKYAEVVEDLARRGFAVVVVDWRGQGGSSRLLANSRKGHVRDFADYRADLEAVARDVLLPHCPRPYVALAHSMGGAIALDHAARGGALFDRLVLSAPMIDLHGLSMPGAARVVAAMVAATGARGAYVPGGSDASWMARPFAGNGLTSDERRFAFFNTLAGRAPDLVLGAPTYGWLHAAFRVMRFLARPATARAVGLPTLLVACGADRVVSTPTAQAFAARLPQGRCVLVPDALHEVLMERDSLRARFWDAFDLFNGSRAAAAGLSRNAEPIGRDPVQAGAQQPEGVERAGSDRRVADARARPAPRVQSPR